MKYIPGFNNHYKIDRYGNVYSDFRGPWRIKSPKIDNGYKRVHLVDSNGKSRLWRINRLVALTYLPNPNNFPIVLHLDNDTLNNHYKNLKWGNHYQNTMQAVREGRLLGRKGELHHMNKLSEKDILEIRQLHSTNNYTLKQLGIKYGVSLTMIGKIVKRQSWSHL
jgi:hypothetical protein